MAKKVELTSENLIDGDEYRDDIFSFIVDWEKRTAQVSINDASIYHVEIPSEIIIDGTFFVVTSFGRCHFDYIEEVVLPPTIISIGDNAFWYCKSLECIIIPEGVLSIGGMSFYECSCLASVTIPKSVKVIGDSAFQNCERLSDVHLLGNDIKIGGNAFDGTRWLLELLGKGESNPLMEKGILYIGNIAYKSTNLCKHVRLKEGTRSISADAFRDCDLTNIYIPDSVKNIAPYAFWGCIYKGINNHKYLIPTVCKALIFNYFWFLTLDGWNLVVTEFQYIFATYFYREEFTGLQKRHFADSVD